MHSPLELEPKLLTQLGLVSARWAALEDALAELLGRFLRVDHAGQAAFSSVANFSQRIDLVRTLAGYCIEDDLHFRIADRLLKKTSDLWNKRNYFVHSHYVHLTTYADNMTVMLRRDDGTGFKASDIDPGETSVKSNSFGYLRRRPRGDDEFVPVNAGTLSNHAKRVARRGRQILAIVKALDTEIIKLRSDSPVTYGRLSPRSPRYSTTPRITGAYTMGVMESWPDRKPTS